MAEGGIKLEEGNIIRIVKKDVLGKRFGEFYKEINEILTTMSIIQEKKVLKSKKNLLDDF